MDKSERIWNFLETTGAYELVWYVIRSEPVMVDHVFKYLRAQIEEFEQRPDDDLSRET